MRVKQFKAVLGHEGPHTQRLHKGRKAARKLDGTKKQNGGSLGCTVEITKHSLRHEGQISKR
jgi:hypothetical protein